MNAFLSGTAKYITAKIRIIIKYIINDIPLHLFMFNPNPDLEIDIPCGKPQGI